MASRRELLGGFAAVLAAGACAPPVAPLRLKVGILHSLTGAMAASELPVARATRFALESATAERLGRPLKLDILEGDGASDDETFASEAERLAAAGVSVVFGCWTSSSRRRVIPVLAARGRLLVYPLQYEGVERSENVLYTGSTPNQQVLPALRWAAARFGRKSFLVGSDYVFPRVATEIMGDALRTLGTEPVGVAWLPFVASPEELDRLASAAVARVIASGAEVVYSTLNGVAGNLAFFRALRASIPVDRLPTVSFSIAEPEALALGRLGCTMVGEHVSWTWLDEPKNPDHAALRDRLTKATGAEGAISDPMFSAMAGVGLWARAVAREDVDPDRVASVLTALAGSEVVLAGQSVIVDHENRHVWKPTRIGRFRGDASIEPVLAQNLASRAVPYPAVRTEAAWDTFTASLAPPAG